MPFLQRYSIVTQGGIFLLVIDVVMAAVITQTIVSHRPVTGGTVMAITNAAYVFYKMSLSVYHLVKAKRNADPVAQALRNLNFADACMSLVSLTVLMYAVFSENSSATETLFVQSAVGFTVCIVLILTACLMIIKANRILRRKQQTLSDQK